MYSLVYGKNVPNTRQCFTREDFRYCIFGSLDRTLVNGTIVLCDALDTREEPLNAGAVGTVMQDDRFLYVAFSFPFPATNLNLSTGGEVYNYINATSEPTAIIEKITEINDELAPFVVSFSLRGPSPIASDILMLPMTAVINPNAEFAYVSGHPVKAVNPGQVYDCGEADYVKFLCGQGYSDKSLRLVTESNSIFCSESNNATVWDLNYPSFTLSSSTKSESITRVFHSTVTNIGSAVSVYKATMAVEPSVLSFKAIGQKMTFAVTVSGVVASGSVGWSGSLVWDNGVYQVRIPIVDCFSIWGFCCDAMRCDAM
ncbi:hypothetical protein Acr_24g0012360 [Actinidia rufa]|uniref:Subtilisin-like protease fibronectin type-III domain-containing protein n=1 Tax=Actinidia rufa TaxID=165716 RepID=A0A7J0GW84_9ERIC|nr:hypothetical protein Acr_24g0012360 [Actinidia rufa]